MENKKERDGDLLISVIVPVYNVEQFLEQCIESIINQTYNNLQIILVDDGSTDRSGEICNHYASLDERIMVIHQKNAGVSAARNRGIENAAGELIAFVDSDDFLPNNAYEKLTAAWSEKAQLVMGQVQRMQADGAKIDRDIKPLPNEIDCRTFVEEMFEEQKFPYLGFPWDKLFLRAIIFDNSLRFNPVIKLNEDRLFILQYLRFCKYISFCNDTVYWYRQRGADVMTDTGRRIVVTDGEMTVLDSFAEMKIVCREFSSELYYICARKAFESALDLLSRVPESDHEKRERLDGFLAENSRICLKNPRYGFIEKGKIIAHTILKR